LLIQNPRCELEVDWAVESLLNAKVDVNGISANHPSTPLIFAAEKVKIAQHIILIQEIFTDINLFSIGQCRDIATPTRSSRDSIKFISYKFKENSSSHCGDENWRNGDTTRRDESLYSLLRSVDEFDHQDGG